MAKRAFDLIFSVVGLVVLSPVLLVLAILVKSSDGGPVFFHQERVGRAGIIFSILKFRSMVANAERLGPGITKDGDPRITGVGRFLRKTKLDELPQLWNVLRGEMSFVGPRPEVPKDVARYTPEQRRVLALKPGMTDPASLEFREEEELLGRVGGGGRRTEDGGRKTEVGGQRSEGGDVEEFYVKDRVPRKIELSLAYAARATVLRDVGIILRTIFSFRMRGGDADGRVVRR